MIAMPPRRNAAPLQIELCDVPLIIVGANGAGKTRFTDHLRESLYRDGKPIWSISTLDGIFEHLDAEPRAGSIEEVYSHMPESELYREPSTRLDCLLRMLLADEVNALMARKLRPDNRRRRPTPQTPTRLDTLIDLWREIFPGNTILIDNGRMMLARGESETYSPLRLSAGERAVMYAIAAILYAPEGAVVFVDDPTIFLHPTVAGPLWDKIESLRPDCRIIYTTHDLDFAASRHNAPVVWVRDYDFSDNLWDYELLPRDTAIPDEVYLAILGSRRPVLFIEGDGVNSIDAKLYPLIFNEYTVKSLGSCNKVIEATRSFNDLRSIHHLESRGIVDRDRRNNDEVAYLRRKGILVPNVAEIENILLLEGVVRAVAANCGKDADVVFGKVKRDIIKRFHHDIRSQALMHTRYYVKRLMEYRVDGRFKSIDELEGHIASLLDEIDPRRTYEQLCQKFRAAVDANDYDAVLRVYNNKSMLPGCNVAGLCGLSSKNEYLERILKILRTNAPQAAAIRASIMRCFGLNA